LEVSEALRKAVADAIVVLVTDGSLRLSKEDVSPDPNTVLSDFIVCDFGGYANIDCGDPILYRDTATGEWVVALSVVGAFTADNTIMAPQTAYAWYLANTGGTALIASGRLDEPFIFQTDGDGIVLPEISIRVSLGSFGSL
jgi:hypothetical protein